MSDPDSFTLDPFLKSEKAPSPAPVPKAPKTRKRRGKAELDREWRIKVLNAEHKLDSRSKTVNLKRCFLTRLRVSNESWEEIRARVLERTCAWAVEAEKRAEKVGRKTILLEDLI